MEKREKAPSWPHWLMGLAAATALWELARHVWLMDLSMSTGHLVSGVGTVLIAGAFLVLAIRHARALGALEIQRQENRSLSEAHEQLKQAQVALVQSEKLASLGALAASVGHDLSGMLANQQMAAELFVHAASEEEKRELLYILGHQTSRLRRMVARLSVSRNGELAEREALDVNALVADVAELFRDDLQRHQVELRVEPSRGVAFARGARAEVESALVNLIRNAEDAMPTGGTLTVSVDADDDQAAIAVTDTGVGIPEEVVGKVFDAFFTTKTAGGTGIGLYWARKALASLGGALDLVATQPGHGSTFRISLPVVDVARPKELRRIEG